MADADSPNPDATEDAWQALAAFANANLEKAAKVYAEYGAQLNSNDVLRQRLEAFIEYELGTRTQVRLEFEEAWQHKLRESVEQMHNSGVQYVKELKAASSKGDPQAAAQLNALQQHRQANGIEGNISSKLLVPQSGLVVPIK